MGDTSLGENIKRRREELKLSQEYVAEQLGVSRQAVSKWETGQSEPTASNLVQLAKLLELSLSQLVEPESAGPAAPDSAPARQKKAPNPILQADLTKWAIIFQSAFANATASHIYWHADSPDYSFVILLDLLLVAACSVWMASNHRFEPDPDRRRKNVYIELGYCLVIAVICVIDARVGMSLVGATLFIAAALVYILYVNPKYMGRKLTR